MQEMGTRGKMLGIEITVIPKDISKTLGKRGKSGALATKKQGLIFQRFKICNTYFERIQNFHSADYNVTSI